MARTGSDTYSTSAVQLGKAAGMDTVPLSSGVQVVTHPSNGGVTFIGYDSSVTANSDKSHDGIPIAAGGGYFIPKINAPTLGSVYVIGSTGTQTISFDPQ